MKKNRILKVFILVFAVTLIGSAVAVQASTPKKQVNTQSQIGTQASVAEDLVNALFTDETHTALVPGVTQATIDIARSAVNLLFPSPLKTFLLELLGTADNLLLQGQLEAAKVIAATNAVNNIFSDDSHTALKVGISLSDITEAQTLVDGLADPLVRAPLNALLVIANNLLDILNLEVGARAAVDNLFTDSNHIGLKIDITQGDIDSAKGLVDALTNVALKAELNLLIASAQIMIDLRNDEQQARAAVYALFADSSHVAIKAGLTQAEITDAKALVDALDAGQAKTELTILVTSAQLQFDGQSAESIATDIVNALFTDSTHTAIVAGLTQPIIDNARNIVNGLPAGQVKTNLITLVNTAQGLFDARTAQEEIVATAQAAVDDLFTDSTHTQIKDGLTQAEIDAAQTKVNLITDPTIRGNLTALIETAQGQFDNREEQEAIDDAAKTAVYALFSDDNHTTIKDGLTQAEIDAAQLKVNSMLPSTLKVELNLLIASAQTQLDLLSPESIAAAIVDALFTDDSHTALIDGITQAAINNALNVVNALPNSAIKTNLLILVNLAQDLYNQANETPAEQDARAAVNDLFADVNHTALKDTTTQAMIDAALAKVNALPAGAVKTELAASMVKAQDLMNERVASNAVDALFTDGTHTTLKPGTTQAMITAAQNLVTALKDGAVKTNLLTLIATAQDLFDETPAETEARAAVNDLFTDDTYTALKPDINQTDINNAKALVDALPAGITKNQLTDALVKAQDLLNERVATAAVNNLFTDETHVAIKTTTTQATIDAARALVDALKTGSVKTALYGHINEAQGLLYQRNENEAIAMVNALFIDSNHTAIKDTTTLEMINAAIIKVNSLNNGQVKTELSILVYRALDLFDERAASILVEGFFVDNTHTALKVNVIQFSIDSARVQVNALRAGQVRTYLIGLLNIAQQLLDQNPTQPGAEYTFWDGTQTFWYRYTNNRKWWNWKTTSPKYTILTYLATNRCASDVPEAMNCATLDRRYDFTVDSNKKITGQIARKWDTSSRLNGYNESTLNNNLDKFVATYDAQTRYHSNSNVQSLLKSYKRFSDDRFTKKSRMENRTSGIQQRYFYQNYRATERLSRLDKVVYNNLGEKRTRGTSRAYFYRQSYNTNGVRTGTTRWTYNTNGTKVNPVPYGTISF